MFLYKHPRRQVCQKLILLQILLANRII